MHGNMPKRIRPKTVENRIRYVLDRNGVTRQQADAIMYSLLTGPDVMPEGVPESFIYRRVKITWPQGVARRMLRPDERKTLNLALEANGNSSTDLLDDECNANEGRLVFEMLWRKTQQPDYVDPTSTRAQLDALVDEADSDPRLHCDATSPGGKDCLLEPEHEGKHKNGRTTWGDRPKPTPKLDELIARPTPFAEPIDDLDRRLDELLNLTSSLV